MRSTSTQTVDTTRATLFLLSRMMARIMPRKNEMISEPIQIFTVRPTPSINRSQYWNSTLKFSVYPMVSLTINEFQDWKH